MGTTTTRERITQPRETTPEALPGDRDSARQPSAGAPIAPDRSVDVDAVWERAETTFDLAHRMDSEAHRCRHTAQHLASILRAAQSRRRSAWARRTEVSREA